MKRFYISMKYFALAILISLSIVGCNKNVSLEPINFQPTTYTSEAQIMSQLATCYANLTVDNSSGFGLYTHAIWGYFSAVDEAFRTDAAIGTTSQVLTESYRSTSEDPTYSNFWRGCYKGIEQANIIIDVIDQPNLSVTKRKNILGQAVFLRAFYHYLLTSNFGDVVLKTVPTSKMGTNFNIPATPSKQIYEFVISEMQKADTLVPTVAQVGNTSVITQTAVEAILARVCLSMAGKPINDQSKYADALFWAEKVINSGVHSLNETPLSVLNAAAAPGIPTYSAYANLFVNNMQNNISISANNSEGIWDAVSLSKSNLSGPYANTGYPVFQQLGALMGVTNNTNTNFNVNPVTNPFGTQNQANFGFSSGTYRAYSKLYSLYQPGDTRRDWAISPITYLGTREGKTPILSVVLTGGGGTGATATAKVDATRAIQSITVDNGGSGYTSAPTVSFIAAQGTGATATAQVSGGKVVSITVSRPGSNYATIYDRPVGKWRREFETNLTGVTRINQYTSCNFPIVRYADVLLMAAEADMMVNGGAPSSKGVEYYNRVRRRAFGFSSNVANPSIDVSTFAFQDIVDERTRELCFEGLRRNDLKRWGIFAQAMQKLLDDNNQNAPTNLINAVSVCPRNFLFNPNKFNLFPIPFSELQADNALIQNQGW